MPEFKSLVRLCRATNLISSSVVDEFLVHYAAARDRVDNEFDNRFSRFKHVMKHMDSGWLLMIKSQYIAHKIFKNGGLLPKYLKHAAIKQLGSEEQDFIKQAAMIPWRFSFSEIKDNPADDFYEMVDVFTDEIYLLYSPSMTSLLSEHPVTLWFNLISFNGGCWQTYGPIGNFTGLDENDIYFFGTELNDTLDSVDDLLEDIENNPVPFMMLLTGSVHPIIQHGDYEILHVTGEGDAIFSNVQALKKDFRIEFAENVFKFSHKVWSEPPHYAEAYYEEDNGLIFLFALTDKGYTKLASILHKYDSDVPLEPLVRLHIPMVNLITDLLKKPLEINPYAKLFSATPSPDKEFAMKKLNKLLTLVMSDINAGKEPDIDALAKQGQVDAESVRAVIQATIDRVKVLKNKK